MGTDASGNPILQDVGVWMKSQLKNYFKDADIKYIEPSYMIRSTPTISSDRIYCKVIDFLFTSHEDGNFINRLPHPVCYSSEEPVLRFVA